MRMIKPNNRTIRRSDHDGVWIQCKTSPRTIHVHAKINRFQVKIDRLNNVHTSRHFLSEIKVLHVKRALKTKLKKVEVKF